jgi:hypothetical protein
MLSGGRAMSAAQRKSWAEGVRHATAQDRDLVNCLRASSGSPEVAAAMCDEDHAFRCHGDMKNGIYLGIDGTYKYEGTDAGDSLIAEDAAGGDAKVAGGTGELRANCLIACSEHELSARFALWYKDRSIHATALHK